MYILNAPMFFRFFWSSVSQLLQPETREKFIFLVTPKQLHEYIDPSIIPQSFGGSYPDNGIIFQHDTMETQYSRAFDEYMAMMQQAK